MLKVLLELRVQPELKEQQVTKVLLVILVLKVLLGLKVPPGRKDQPAHKVLLVIKEQLV